MLWYGYIYYVISFFGVFILSTTLLKLFYHTSVNYLKVVKDFIYLSLHAFLFFSLLVFTIIYYSLDFYTTFCCSYSSLGLYTYKPFSFFDNTISSYLLNLEYTNLTLVSVYSFPFIYIFIFITMLSLLFCLSYNINELLVFSFYVTLIFIAGYVLFFTDSLILFFFSYETLLVPSFFILYNFAKTRRCVEAAYLMFF